MVIGIKFFRATVSHLLTRRIQNTAVGSVEPQTSLIHLDNLMR